MTEEVVDTSVVADELQHTSSHQRHDDELAHTRDAATQRTYPVPGWERPRAKPDSSTGEDTEGEHGEYVHASDGRDEDEEVGEGEEEGAFA